MQSVNEYVQTSLVVLDKNLTYHLETSNFEVYSAGRLKENVHYRITQRSDKKKFIESTTYFIPLGDHTSVDRSNDVLHVYRYGSPFLMPLLHNLKFNISLVARITMRYGIPDTNRKDKIGRILNFGVNAELGLTTDSTIQVKGKNFFVATPPAEKQEFFYSMQSIGQLIWRCLCSMQVEAR